MKISRLRPRKFANKIILLVLSLECASILLWGSLTYFASKKELTESISKRLQETAIGTASDIGHFFMPIDIELQLNAPLFRRPMPAERQKILLSRIFNNRPEIEAMRLLDRDGREKLAYSRMDLSVMNGRQDWSQKAYVRTALKGEVARSNIEFSHYLEPHLVIAYPVRFAAGRGVHAILVSVNLKWLWDIVQHKKIGASGYIFILDEKRKLVAHPDPSQVLSGGSLGRYYSNILFNRVDRDGLSIYRNLNGKKVAGAALFDAAQRWWVVVELPVKEGLAPLDRLVRRFLLAFVMAVCLTVAVALLFSKITMRPLVALEQGIARFSRGEHQVRVAIPGCRELGSLAKAFNRMAENLQDQQQKLLYQAEHDELTGLPNRNHLYRGLRHRIELEEQRVFSILLVDLDRFKEVNDTLGHQWGDILLRQLGDRLKSYLRHCDLLARLGGDEFAVVLDEVDAGRAKYFAMELRTAIQEPLLLENINIQVDASIGISCYPEHDRTIDGLLRTVDVAMYEAKRSGSRIEVYSEHFDVNDPARLHLVNGLRQAILEDQLVLYYQPKIALPDKRVCGVEALVRWNHPQLGLLTPERFLPYCELSDVMNLLTHWVIERGLQDLKAWQAGTAGFSIAINISVLSLQDSGFAAKIIRLARYYGVDPGTISLEITETALMRDVLRSKQTIGALADHGVRIAVDDFGTGYSSLAYLKALAVDELKIDKSFVMDMENNDNDAVIVASTIDLARNLGLKVTAEGVETASALRQLMQWRCDYAQGYYVAKPMAFEVFCQWLDARQYDAEAEELSHLRLPTGN